MPLTISRFARFSTGFLTAVLPCFITFKTLVGLREYPDSYPGEPLNRFTMAQWWSWVVDWHAIAAVALVTLAFFAIGFRLFRSLPSILIILWGGLLGAYAALISFDMVVPALDRMGDWVSQLVGENKLVGKGIGIVEIALALTAPLGVAWLLGFLDRWIRGPGQNHESKEPK